MSVYKRGEWFHWDFWSNGKRYTGTTRTKVRREALDAERHARNALDNGTYVTNVKGKKTFEDYVPRVMDNVRLRHPNKPRTVDFYQNNYDRICANRKFATLRLTDINESHLTDFALACKRQGAMEATINRRLASIRKLLRLAQREKLVTTVPHVEMLAGERKREYVIVGNEREVFLAGLTEPTRSIADFLFETGLRISEAISLEWVNVIEDGEGAYVKVVAAVSKSKKERHVPLSSRALAIVKFQKSLSQSQFIFVRYGEKVKRGRKYVAALSRHTVSEHFTSRRKEMGLPWDAVLHSTRHSALTELGASGAGAFTIMAIAGHANVTTSQRYVHPIPEEVRRAFERKAVYQEMRREEELVKARAVGSIQ